MYDWPRYCKCEVQHPVNTRRVRFQDPVFLTAVVSSQCGMARLSKRSITAVCTFMFSAFAVSAVISPDNRTFASGTEWLRTDAVPVFFNRWLGFGCSFLFIIPTCVALYNLLQKENFRRSSLVVLKRQASIHFPKAKISDILDETNEGSSFADDSKALETTEYSTMTLEKTKTIKEEDLESGGTCPNPVTSEVGSVSGDEDTKIQEDAVEKKWSELRNQFKATQKKLGDGKIVPAALAACVFALGLAISQMVLPSKVLGFLALYTMSTSTEGSYDPTLLTVMVGGSIVSFLSYQFVDGWGIIKNPWAKRTPLSSSEFCVPKNNVIDWQLLVGAFCFGVGWALAGLCPGPATFLAASGTKPVLAYWWPLYFVGAFAAQKLKDRAASS